LVAELRWILLGLSLPLLAGIWWWTARRARQAPGNAELRESTVAKPAEAPTPPPLDPRYIDPDEDDMQPATASRDWGVPPFEPLNIHTADFDHVPVLDGPMMVSVEPAPAAASPPWSPPPAVPGPQTAMPPLLRPTATTAPVGESSDRFGAGAPSAANPAELQRIVTIRVCAVGETRWSGAQLMTALELHGLAFGRYQVFHRKHVDGRSLFCVASLIEPGTFDIAGMADQEFRGVTVFAVLPGPLAPLETIDELFATARGLAEALSGMVQDANGMPLSPQRAAALREDVARFQASLPKD
jgi:cell division protein ZipA